MENPDRPGTSLMPYLVAASQVLGVAVLAITGTWLSQYRGGFSWDGPQQFNVHPLCMVLGMVFLCGDAHLVYRVFRYETKKATKILHGTLHLLALIISLVGIIAVFQFHKKKNIPDMYSMHSWLGIMTFSLYILQWILGFIMFFVPGVAYAYKSRFKPLHVFLGTSLLVSTIATCLLGLTEKVLFTIIPVLLFAILSSASLGLGPAVTVLVVVLTSVVLPKTQRKTEAYLVLGMAVLPMEEYSKFPAEGILVNCLALLLVAFGAVIVYILTREEWKRPPLPEEQALSIDFKTLTEGESPSEH